jgi:hypothetical protein
MTVNNKEPKVLQDSDGCEHLWLDYEPGPCPTCAEIKAAREEVLEMACKAAEWTSCDSIRDAYRERFGS